MISQAQGQPKARRQIATAKALHRTLLRLALVFVFVLAYGAVRSLPTRADGRWRRFSAPRDADPKVNLVSNDIRALAYDRDEYGVPRLWVGTDLGLQTYNGRDWQDHTVPATGVTALLVDDVHDVLWVGTERGLYWRVAQDEWRTQDLDGVPISSLAPDGRGGAYVGTDGGGVWHCQPDGDGDAACTVWLAELHVRALLYHSGVLWIGTDDGLERAVGTQVIPYSTADGLVSDRITALAVDSRNRLWIGTEDGITRYDESARIKWVSLADTGHISGIAVDSRDRVWAATDAGLLKWDPRWENRGRVPTAWQRLGASTGDLRDDQVALVYAQVPGLLWVVTASGLNALDGSWETYSAQRIASDLRLLLNEVHALARDEATGEVWAGTNVGVSHYDPSTDEWDRTWTTEDGIVGEVYALVRDAESGEMWAGTSNGAFYYEPGETRWDKLGSSADDLGNNLVYDIVREAGNGTLWAGTNAGLVRYDPDIGRWVQTWPAKGQSGDAVYRLVHDEAAGELWLGTSAGVVQYRPGVGPLDLLWPVFEQVGQQPRISALLRDHGTGELWVGESDWLLTYDGGAWNVEQASDEVFALARDPQTGVLWAGTGSGVSRYDPNLGVWDDISAGVSGINGREVRALAQDERGEELWVGTDGTIARFSATKARSVPWARVTLALSESENRLQGERVKLLDANDVVYQFEGGSLIAELGDLRYGYRIEGRETRWTTPDQGLEASYADLPYGEYAFELWAQDGMGWQSEARRYPLVVQARPVVTVTHVREQEIVAGEVYSFPARPAEVIPIAVRWSDPDDPGVRPQIQAGWFDPQLDEIHTVQAGETLYSIAARYGQTVQQLAGYNGITNPDLIPVGQQLRIPVGDPPDRLCAGGEIAANCWITLTLYGETAEGEGDVPVLDTSGLYQLLVRALDAHDNPSVRHQSIQFRVSSVADGSSLVAWLGVLGGVAIVVAAGYSLRHYPDYASSWGAAYGRPVQQLIPLVAPLSDPLDVPRMQAALRKRQAFTTPDQVQVALDALVRSHILAPAEGGGYLFADPFVAWIHRLRNLGRRDTLAEAVRSRHPLYAGARAFFSQAGFDVQELSPEALLLTAGKGSHGQASYGTIYTRLVAGRALQGDDFEDVDSAARVLYGGEVSHRLAFVVINRRPTPGARLRLYEIRQSSGLAIVTLDNELFGQVKPNMPAGDILTAQIDQATGRQNLYAISGPVSDDLGFFGREIVVQQLIDLIDAGQPVGVFGLRKTGKTSLLQRLRGHLATRRVIASLDTQGTAREHGVLPFYPAIIGAFVAHIRQYRAGLARSIPPLHLHPAPRGRTLLPEISRVFADDLRDLHQLIGGDERLLLILDEVDRLLPVGEDPGYEGFSAFLGQLRAANQGLKVLDFIVAGVDPAVNRRDVWREHDNELYQALREVWMPPMRPEATREMIESMGFQMGLQYEPAALERIVRAGGGHPFLTRQMCSQIVRDLLDRGAMTITDEQARLGIEDYVYLPDSYLTELWRARLDEAERDLLLRLARADAPIPRDDLLPAEQRQAALSTLGELEEQTVIHRHDGGYVIGWPVLRDWIRWIELGLEE